MKKSKAVLLALLVMLFWGSLYPLAKFGYAQFEISGTGSLLLFAGVRFMICGAAICIFRLFTGKEKFKPVIPNFGGIALAGFFGVILQYSCSYLALVSTSSAKTAIIKQIGVLLYVCFSFVFFKEERPTVKKIFAVLLGIAGVAVINLDGGKFTFAWGDLLIFISSCSSVMMSVVDKHVYKKVDPIVTTGTSQLFGGAVLTVIGLALGGTMHATSYVAYLTLAAICTASTLGYCIWAKVVEKSDLSEIFITKFTQPIFAAIIGVFLLGENIFKWTYLAAFILISAGIFIVQYKKNRSNKI